MATVNDLNYYGEIISLKTLIKELIGELISEGAFVFSTTANSEDLKLIVNGKTTSVSLQNPIRNAVKSMISSNLYLSIDTAGEIKLTAKDNANATNSSSVDIDNSVQNKVASMVKNNQLYTDSKTSDTSKVFIFAKDSDNTTVNATKAYNVAAASGNYVKYATALVPYSVSDSTKDGNIQTITEQGDVTSESNAYPVRAVGTDGDLYGHTLTLN